MKNLVILGAGTAGTTAANRLRKQLDGEAWRITIVDQDADHNYQPGYLFIPFGLYTKKDVVKPRRSLLPAGVELMISAVEVIEPDKNRVRLMDGTSLQYDFLIVATGCRTDPEATPGLSEHAWHQSIFDFYTLQGAQALAEHLRTWQGGRLVVNVVDYPIKCPVAPLEFLMMADWFFHQRGLRKRVEITFATPLPGAFNQPIASHYLGGMLEQKGVRVVPDFMIERVDPDARKIIAYDETEIEYDLLVSVPLNRGAGAVSRSGMGDELDFIPVDRRTFIHAKYANIFVLGDAAALPTSKAGSVAHYATDCFSANFLRYQRGQEMQACFDGHSTCFIESGYGKAVMIDFNYDVEPLPGHYPLPGFGPFRLLQETRVNHWGKKAFRWLYWTFLVKGHDLAIAPKMSMAGKRWVNIDEA
jgi:sulfide:quinone oxidoreductase